MVHFCFVYRYNLQTFKTQKQKSYILLLDKKNIFNIIFQKALPLPKQISMKHKRRKKITTHPTTPKMAGSTPPLVVPPSSSSSRAPVTSSGMARKEHD